MYLWFVGCVGYGDWFGWYWYCIVVVVCFDDGWYCFVFFWYFLFGWGVDVWLDYVDVIDGLCYCDLFFVLEFVWVGVWFIVGCGGIVDDVCWVDCVGEKFCVMLWYFWCWYDYCYWDVVLMVLLKYE